jgi:hypothetical protein
MFGASQFYATSVAAYAPDTQPVSVTATWNGTNCNTSLVILADEFGAAQLDGHVEAPGDAASGCMSTITTAHDRAVLWGACTTKGNVLAVGAGFTRGGEDGFNDWSEFKLTSDPAGTDELVSFDTDGFPTVLTAVALQPQ